MFMAAQNLENFGDLREVSLAMPYECFSCHTVEFYLLMLPEDRSS
jgi:hypothetical protein